MSKVLTMQNKNKTKKPKTKQNKKTPVPWSDSEAIYAGHGKIMPVLPA
jgi:hypothetical protein